MIKTIMVGSVSITRPAEMFTAKPPHVPKPDELARLAHQVNAFLDYAEGVSSIQTVNDASAAAARLKKYMDKMYNRMYKPWQKGSLKC